MLGWGCRLGVGVFVVVEVVVVVGGRCCGRGGVGVFEGLVLLERLVEGSLGSGFVTAEEVEGVGFLWGGAGEVGEEVGGGLVLREGFEGGVGDGFLDVVAFVVGEVLLVVFDCGAVFAFDSAARAGVGVVEEFGFGLGVEAEFPGEEGEAFDEEVFEGGGGVEVLLEVVEEGGVVGAVGLGDEGVWVEARGEGVGLGVGVSSAGRELGGHESPPLLLRGDVLFLRAEHLSPRCGVVAGACLYAWGSIEHTPNYVKRNPLTRLPGSPRARSGFVRREILV